MESTIKVKRIEEFQFSNGTKTGWNVFDQDDKKYGTFSSTIKTELDLALLDEKERKIDFIEKETNGYMNRTINKIANPDGVWIEGAKPSGGGGGFNKKDVGSIEAQVAMKAAVELCVAGKIELKEIGSKADEIRVWITKHKEVSNG